MSNSVAAKRYAIALFQLAKEKKVLGILETEAQVIERVFKENAEAFSVFSSQKLPIEKKKQFVKNCFPELSAEMTNTLMIMVERKREASLLEMLSIFMKLIRHENDEEQAFVHSAKPLSEDERNHISAVFSKKVGKKSLQIENVVLPEMLGGLKIRIGNQIFDGSLNGKLERLHRHILDL